MAAMQMRHHRGDGRSHRHAACSREPASAPRPPAVATAEKRLRHTASPLERAAAMPIEAALVKPLVDVLMGLFRQGENLRLKSNAEAALREAIRELLLASPDDNKAEARIAVAKAAGILSEDVVLAEDMLKKTRAAKARTRGKAATGRKRKPAASKTAAKSAPAKKAAKPAAKKAAPKKRTGATAKKSPRPAAR